MAMEQIALFSSTGPLAFLSTIAQQPRQFKCYRVSGLFPPHLLQTLVDRLPGIDSPLLAVPLLFHIPHI